MIIGAVLVSLALFLFLYNQWDADRAEKCSAEVVQKLKEEIEAGETPDEDTAMVKEMKTVTIDGYEYIGYLSVPALDLELPVMAEWSYPGLKIAPGRFSGSTYSRDLVIAGHNYARHFSPIKWLDPGTEIDFRDVEDHVWKYQIASTETLNPTQVKEMITKTAEDDWDLTLFTCNTGGQTRCTVRCQLLDINP